MKIFKDLNSQEKTLAVRRSIDLLISLISEGVVELDMPTLELQHTLRSILFEARAKDNQSQIKQKIMSNPKLKSMIEAIAVKAAKRANYDLNANFLMDNQ